MILEISNPLSLGNQSDDVARVHQALRALGRSLPIDETANRVLGPQTVAVLKALQAELGVAVTGIVNAATVRSINAKLAKLPTDVHEVRGTVRDANRNPATTGFVLLHLQDPAEESVLGQSPLDATTGAYRITFELPPDSAGRLDLRIEVQDANGPVETTPSGASILTGAGPLEVVDFVLSGEKNAPPSEFEQILPRSPTVAGTTRLGKIPAEVNGDGPPIRKDHQYEQRKTTFVWRLSDSEETDERRPPEILHRPSGLLFHPAAGTHLGDGYSLID